MEMIADRCNRCGKTVVKSCHGDSSDMVKTNDSFLYLCDMDYKSESSRPCLQLKDYPDKPRLYCLDCLAEEVTEWVEKMKKRGDSDIPLDHIIFSTISPCPTCGK